MPDPTELVHLAKQAKKELFYNTSGSKTAYQLGVKHISSAEYLGFADSLPNGDLYIKKDFLLIDFEKNKVFEISRNMRITPVALQSS
jgi:hypothetical protein